MYNLLVLPLFDYSSTDQTYLKRLQMLQNKGARLILNCYFRMYIKDRVHVKNNIYKTMYYIVDAEIDSELICSRL